MREASVRKAGFISGNASSVFAASHRRWIVATTPSNAGPNAAAQDGSS
jgi:hypothetical protein